VRSWRERWCGTCVIHGCDQNRYKKMDLSAPVLGSARSRAVFDTNGVAMMEKMVMGGVVLP
jgi:hypothetical protein